MNVVLLDGGLGQELLKRWGKKPHPLWSAQVMIENPEIVQSVHEDYIRAGARVITTNSYILTPERLTREGVPEQFIPLQKRAIDLANAARDAVGMDVDIAGCLPPLHASYRPDLSRTVEYLEEKYSEIADQQKGKVDLIIAETMASVAESVSATKAAKNAGLDIWTAMTCDDANIGKLRSGEAVDEAVAALSQLAPDAVLLNCSRPETINANLSSLEVFPIFGAYANAFTEISGLEVGGTVATLKARTDLAPEPFAKLAMGWVDRGAKIIGGCCETTPAHIKAIAQALEVRGSEITSWSQR